MAATDEQTLYLEHHTHMDRANLFSRGATPPNPPQHQSFPQNSNSNPPNTIDSLFQSISAPSPDRHLIDSHSVDNTFEVVPDDQSNPTPTDRQSTLLSLIGRQPQPTQPQPQQPSQPQPQPQPQPQQVPTPPGSSQRSDASPPQAGTQQKLLEQLMSGASSRTTNYSEPQRTNPQPGQSPPYPQREEYRNYGHDQASEASPRLQAVQHSHLAQQQQQQQPPSPRRSIFEFTSPFDHLPVKKKPAPPAQPASIASSTDESASWSTITDPKRQSVENLLENLTRSQPPPPQAHPPAYEAYLSGSDFSQAEAVPTRAPLPPIPTTKAIPIRNPSPPKNQTLHRPQPRAGDINVNSQSPHSQSPHSQSPHSITHTVPPRRDNENSPGARGSNQRSQKAHVKFNNKSQSGPSTQMQTIVFDVSQSLDEIQARESVKWTAIALVKQDSVFLPGTTIGATHWVAYAMTKGRVRVISRSSGDRTLLQLPQIFSHASSVVDMAVYGNRLAGVTSDGGFVVWELPEVITDDVPGRLLLCIPPGGPDEAIRAVKWHPKDRDILAIASDKNIYVIDLANTHALHGQPLPHSELHHIGQLFNVPSTIVAFDFDVVHYAIATISEDSTLTIWNMHDRLPYVVQTINGEDTPSSLTFVDGGFVVGRKNGTVFQLLATTTKTVFSTVKFVNGATSDDIDMFGHISYDSRIQTLWVSNSRRDSLIALKVNIDTSYGGGDDINNGHIEQVVEFVGIKPTIHFVILTGDADPHGTEANAACIAAKVPLGELALVAFSVHSSGVDQILIRKEWFDMALAQAESKFPAYDLPQNVIAPLVENKVQQQQQQSQQRQPLPVPPTVPQPPPHPAIVSFAPPPNPHTPPSDDIDNEYAEGRLIEQKFKGNKGKAVGWKEKEESFKEKEKTPKATDASVIGESNLGQALSREIKKTEESLHNRIGRLIGKEMDKQHQRFEEARLHEQAEDFARQEKILKLISTELTRNTTRVVEMAVKNEIQNSVLPSLENITKNEVKGALNDQIGISLIDVINRSLPVEMEKLLLRPTISNHFANILSTALTPLIERHIKEVLTTTFFQFHSQQTAAMHQDLLRELRSEISNIKSELGTWHNESMRNQEATIRDLEHTVRALSEQVKFLSINSSSSHSSSLHHQQPQNSPGAQAPSLQTNITPSHLRQANIAPVAPNVPTYTQTHPSFQPQPPQPQIHQQWYSGIAAPQASHPATIPQPPVTQPQEERSPPVKSDQWDEIYLGVLHSQDPTKLRDLLSRTNPDVVLPLNGTPLVSQAVILTLVHRLSAVVGDTAPNDELFKTSLWWLQRVAGLLRPEDKLISDFIPRVIPTVQQSLNTTKQRLAILPGGSATMETARALSEVQEALRRKVVS